MTRSQTSFLSELERSFHSSQLFAQEPEINPYTSDHKTGFSGFPCAVFFPSTEAEIQHAISLCKSFRIPIIPRGAGTGRSGGAVPCHGGLVLSMERMKETKELDEESFFIEVEAGKILQTMQEEAEAQKLFYPPDPASLASCTIGGNVATNAGGPRAFKYGVTKDYILGLHAILPNGEKHFFGDYTRKGVAGYNLAQMLVGSEGTLGVITSVVCKLIPKPQQTRTFLLQCKSLVDATKSLNQLLKSGFFPVTMELIDPFALSCMRQKAKDLLHPQASAVLLLELDGDENTLFVQENSLQQQVRLLPCLELVRASNDKEKALIWNLRRGLSDALRERYEFKFSEDIVVPRSKLTAFVSAAEQLSTSSPIDIAMYGHAGDGNLHVNFLWNEPQHARQAFQINEGLFRKVIELRGTITGEHGIGLTKRNYLPWEKSEAFLSTQQQLKESIDPSYLFNPGKIFPVPSHIPTPLFEREPLVTPELKESTPR